MSFHEILCVSRLVRFQLSLNSRLCSSQHLLHLAAGDEEERFPVAEDRVKVGIVRDIIHLHHPLGLRTLV